MRKWAHRPSYERDGKHSEGRSHEQSGDGMQGVSEQRLPFEGKEGRKEHRRKGNSSMTSALSARTMHQSLQGRGEERREMTMIMMPAAKGVQTISEIDNASGASQAYRQLSIIASSLPNQTPLCSIIIDAPCREANFPTAEPFPITHCLFSWQGAHGAWRARSAGPRPSNFFSSPTKEIGVTDCCTQRRRDESRSMLMPAPTRGASVSTFRERHL